MIPLALQAQTQLSSEQGLKTIWLHPTCTERQNSIAHTLLATVQFKTDKNFQLPHPSVTTPVTSTLQLSLLQVRRLIRRKHEFRRRSCAWDVSAQGPLCFNPIAPWTHRLSHDVTYALHTSLIHKRKNSLVP